MKTILLCDDSRLSTELLELKLKKYDCKIIGKAKNGQEGIDMFKKLSPDYVFLDITMPIKDGKECLQGIININPKAQVIMLTALADESTIRQCLSAGAIGYMKKNNIADQNNFDSIIKTLPIQLEKVS